MDYPENHDQDGGSSVSQLTQRMRDGDREAVGELIERYGDRIRYHVSLRLSPGMRRVYDSLDVVGSLSRRLDHAVRCGQVDFPNERALWSYLKTVAEHVVIDHARVCRRFERVERDEKAIATRLLFESQRDRSGSSGAGDQEWLERVMALIDEPTDRFILCAWLADRPHTQTAVSLGVTAQYVRTRWSRLKDKLSMQLSEQNGVA